MGEIYRDSVNKAVTLDITGATVMSAKFKRGTQEYTGTVSGSSALVPYTITRVGGDFQTVWTYSISGNQYTRTDNHVIVSPMFTKDQLVAWDADFSMLTDEQVVRLEKTIRAVIEYVTGQKFNYEYDTIAFRGNGSRLVGLPKRLVEADGIVDGSGGLIDAFVKSGNDGWTLNAEQGPTWVDAMTSTNPIRNPYKAYGIFKNDLTYTISGYFGYTSIPEDVILAAKILAEDYGCDESLWRDRYIDNIRAADWRFEFNGRAFSGTGNVKVDQILQKYTLGRMVVL